MCVFAPHPFPDLRSMYASLRTNLPREVMGFCDFPFVDTYGWVRAAPQPSPPPLSRRARIKHRTEGIFSVRPQDDRRFCGHEEVQAYLTAFADAHGLRKHIRLGTRVLSVSPASAPAADSSEYRCCQHHFATASLTHRSASACRADLP